MPAKKLFLNLIMLLTTTSKKLKHTRRLGHKSSTMSSSQGMETMHKNSLALEKEKMKINIPSPTCTNR
ncbi:hypothetical protein H5410_046808, partial [Solanum commersonii]